MKYLLGVYSFVILVSCARELKKESDLNLSLEDFKQEIQSVSKESLNQIIQANEKDDNKSEQAQSQNSAAEINISLLPKSKEESSKLQHKLKNKKSKKIKEESGDAEKNFWQPTSWPFGVGEKISLVLKYGPIEAGVATLEVMDPKVINGEAVLHYQAKVRSTKLMELIYKVNDTMSTWTGLYDHLPRRQEINQLESGRWGKRVVLFNQSEMKAKFFAFTNFPNGRFEEIKREDSITQYTQDVLGALYFVRFMDPMEAINFPIHDRWKNWANELTYLGKEKVKVPAGVFDTFHYKMLPRVSGQLEPKGDVEIWVWDHPSRLMVQFSANVKVGAVTGELKEYTEGRAFTIKPPLLKTPKVLDAKIPE